MSTIHSACECQAVLFATLDERHLVRQSWAVRRVRTEAPAYSLHPEATTFDVVWSCPFCGRNSLRSFRAAALRPSPDSAAAGSGSAAR
jgi:hypothetical protein